MAEQIKSFGMRELKIAELLTDTDTETTYGDFIQAVGVQNLELTPIIEEYELPGK